MNSLRIGLRAAVATRDDAHFEPRQRELFRKPGHHGSFTGAPDSQVANHDDRLTGPLRPQPSARIGRPVSRASRARRATTRAAAM